MGRIRVGKPHVRPDAPSHVSGVHEGNERGAYESEAGFHPDGTADARRSTGIRPKDHNPMPCRADTGGGQDPSPGRAAGRDDHSRGRKAMNDMGSRLVAWRRRRERREVRRAIVRNALFTILVGWLVVLIIRELPSIKRELKIWMM
jgi:hypothetical protein